jgi:hypothetical protein
MDIHSLQADGAAHSIELRIMSGAFTTMFAGEK